MPRADGPADDFKQSTDQSSAKDLLPDHKYRKALVTRVVKAVKTPLEDALRNESELCQKTFEKEFAHLDKLLENSASRCDLRSGSQHSDNETRFDQLSALNRRGGSGGNNSKFLTDEGASDGRHMNGTTLTHAFGEGPKSKRQRTTPASTPSANGLNGVCHRVDGFGPADDEASKAIPTTEPPTPPRSAGGDSQPLASGGIPWYMELFDPVGTTIEEERWTGRELVRGMSEGLSEIDEEELLGLAPGEAEAAPDLESDLLAEQAAKLKAKKRKAARARRRW